MPMRTLSNVPIKIYADGADLATIKRLAALPYISGITTNPSLMRKAGVTNYEAFASEVLMAVEDKPVSFEVLSDDIDEMHRQALRIHSWAPNVFVKIPICTTQGESCTGLINRLSMTGVKVNVTAILTRNQLTAAICSAYYATRAIFSVFAGRIADTGGNPAAMIHSVGERLENTPLHDVLWASTREVGNIMHASDCGCAIITIPADLLAKAEKFLGYDLDALTLDTVKQFVSDAQASGYTIN